MIGQTVDNEFKIKRLLGTGAFGSVYEAEELSLNRLVALKVLKSPDGDEKQLERFLGEARLLAKLNHENVVRVIRLGEHEGSPYMVMEFITGETLGSIIDGPRIPLARAVNILSQVCRGLAAIHSVGVVHRDLSRNNIMVTPDGTAKILDLGLAKTVSLDSKTMEQYLTGTVGYISPEQVQGGKATRASDVFAFGVVCYELLTGSSPFQAEHYMSVLYNIAHRDPEPLTACLSRCPETLSQIVTNCLEKRPEDRPTDLGEIDRLLGEIAADLRSDSSEMTTIKLSNEELAAARVSKSVSNPYLNRVMVKRREDFFGRTREIRRIFSRLNATPPGSVSLVGDRKIGKSSLLNHVYNRRVRNDNLEQPEKMVMVFLDLQQEKNMTLETFVASLLSMATYELRGRLDISNCGAGLDGIRNMVQRLDQNGFRLCILLDEFEAVTTNENFDLEFFSFLRYLANHYNVAYLTSSAHHLQSLCHTKEISDSPFFNIFSALRLSAFSRKEAEELIRVPSERVDKPLVDYTEKILDISGLFPFFIQIACAHCIEFLEENPEGELSFAEIRNRFYEEAKLHYQYMWSVFDSHERSAMTRIARGKSIPDALRHVLGELATRRYIDSEQSSARLFSSTFEEFVRVSEESKKKSVFQRLLRRG